MSNFYDHFRASADRWPQNVALEIQRHHTVERYSYAQLRDLAEAIAGWLLQNGQEKGARCAILAENHPRWVAAYLGVIAAGCVAVPLDTAFHADQVAKLLADSGSSLLFCDGKHLAVAELAVSSLTANIVMTDQRVEAGGSVFTPRVVADLDSIFAQNRQPFVPPATSSEEVAALLYTSGTTADPKGVMLTHSNLLSEVDAVTRWVTFDQGDAVLGILPLFHVLSQMANLFLPLAKGARSVFLETLNTTELLRGLQEREITAFAVVPQFFYLIHERIFKEAAKRGALAERGLRGMMAIHRGWRRLGFNAGRKLFGKIHQTLGSKMRYLVTGGSRFDPRIAQDFHDLGIDILQAYGLTETSAAAFATHPLDNVIGSVGKPFAGVEGQIVDPQPQEGGGPAVGEIALRGPIVMKGYWKRPDATAAVLKDGWLYTGDLGYFDADGNLFITGRRKEVIVLSNGKNVYPEEIEAHYLKSPFIKELCVMGLETRPGDPSSDRLFAVIVPNFEVLRQRKIVNAKEVIRFDIESLSAQIATTKRVGNYEIWQEDLPRTTTRKIKRFEVEKRVSANRARETRSDARPSEEKPLSRAELLWLERSEVDRALVIVRHAAQALSGDLRPDQNLELDLGLDSMQRVELLVELEQALGGSVKESRASEIYTVRELVDAVLESAAGGKEPSQAQFVGWSALLKEEATDPEVLALVKPRPVAETFWFGVSRLVQLIALDRFHLQVSGVEKVPLHRACILSSNHQSFLDAPVLGSVLPAVVFRNTFSVGTSDIFGSGFMRHLAGWLRVVVLDPDANLIPAMRAGAFGLRHGRVLILYPEGERSIDGPPKTFKKGAAILSIHMQVPIVPIAVQGFHEAWPRSKPFQKFARLRMRFGDPIYPPPEASASEAAYAALTAEVKRRVLEMWENL